jgi:predicted RNase H-like nuclease (RuvC/YqgF family)
MFSVSFATCHAAEFVKQNRKVEEQQATIAELKKELQSKLAEQQTQIKALASSLEKVTAQIEVSKFRHGTNPLRWTCAARVD